MAVQVLEGIGRKRAGVSGKMGPGLQKPQQKRNGGYLERGMMDYETSVIYATKLTVACSMMESIEVLDFPEDLKKQLRETYRMLNYLRRKTWAIADNCNYEGESE